jgi:cytochrome P450
VVTRFEDIAHILEDEHDFSARHETIPFPPILVTMLEHDGALHDDFRRLLQPYFSPKKIVGLEHIARDLTVSLIDGFYSRGECEFTQEFAMHMPIIIVMNLCHFPREDTSYLIQISDDIVRSGSSAVEEAAFARAAQYLGSKIIPARRANPGEDMISAIVHGKVDGGRAPTDTEILGLCTLLIVGGLDTVASMLGFVTAFLARHPEHRRQLVDDPKLIPQALEELFRRHGVANVGRVAVRDVDYRGVHIKAGDFILTPTTAAGLDERHYPEPMAVDFRRADRKHLAFGRGPHQCIGSFLARTEMRVFLTEWLRRIPDFQIPEGAQVRLRPGKANRITHLPLTWQIP